MTTEARFPFRYALMLDGYSRKEGCLNKVSQLEALVREVAKRANMAILHMSSSDVGMDVKQLGRDPIPEEAGYSVLGLISTSHIALHTWPKLKYFMFDIASCKRFNRSDIEHLIRETLGVDRFIVNKRIPDEDFMYDD